MTLIKSHIKSRLTEIPENPGCYLYLNSSKKIIYIGKAKNLKKRVSSYFNKKDLDSKTEALVSHIHEIDFIATNSEVEALILENSLIKKNKPKYNIDLKDSKGYAYIEKTSEEFPRFIVFRPKGSPAHQLTSSPARYGPFISAQGRDYILQTINKTFRIRTCKKLPKRKCLRYDIGICSAPCISAISKKEYSEDIRQAELILKGKTKELELNLKKKMKEYSQKQNYEKAMIIREKINSIEYLSEKQRMQREKEYNEDIINYIIKEENVYLMLFNIYKGTLENKKEFTFEYKKDFLDEFLVRYYSEQKIPQKIIIPQKVDSSIQEFLAHSKKSKVNLVIPQKGDLKELSELVKKNIELHYFGDSEKLEELKKKLSLNALPQVIECFDISHLGGTEVVASMVQFRGGKPDKSNYRKFKIRYGDKNDDFAAMNEVVKRRYNKLKKEETPFPDLIVVDGGKGQLSSSIKSLKEIGIRIPIVSLAKKEEEVFIPGVDLPVRIDPKNKARLLLQSIRNEAHRFAVKYQRERRSKRIFKK
jgi:excinuclease ABC subunit C